MCVLVPMSPNCAYIHTYRCLPARARGLLSVTLDVVMSASLKSESLALQTLRPRSFCASLSEYLYCELIKERSIIYLR